MNPSTDIEERYCGCCYCGQGWSYQGVEPPDELVKEVCEHERVCPKNPYTARIRELEAEIERLKEELANTTAQRDAAINTFLKEENDQFVDANKMVPTPRTDAFQKGDGLLETWEQEWEAAILCSTRQKLEAEVERLKGRMKEAEDLIKGLHDGWKKARTAHLETCKNAQAEIDKLHTENICLQELIQEFYEWTKREYPTEQEVREIMNRYHNLLNK